MDIINNVFLIIIIYYFGLYSSLLLFINIVFLKYLKNKKETEMKLFLYSHTNYIDEIIKIPVFILLFLLNAINISNNIYYNIYNGIPKIIGNSSLYRYLNKFDNKYILYKTYLFNKGRDQVSSLFFHIVTTQFVDDNDMEFDKHIKKEQSKIKKKIETIEQILQKKENKENSS